MEGVHEQQPNRADIKLLVVDDREDNLLSIETILDRDGYTIRKANSGRAALKILLNEHDFTLILMDVQMPDMNGFETAELIYQREKLKHIPIIFITAHNHDEQFMFEGYKMGGVDFIYKPINPDLLRYKVSVFAELYRKTHELMMQETELKAANASLENEIEERRVSEEKIKLLNRQLLDNNLELQAINEELDRFAYVASHDLQEPLRKILIFSDVVTSKLKDKADEDVMICLHKIAKASERMQRLINDLLKFSRHANSNEDFEETNLNEVLNDVLADVELDIQKKQATVEWKDLPVIWAIPSQVRQLFQNLISNSLKFSRPGTAPRIEVYAETVYGVQVPEAAEKYDKNIYHRISIKDNGIGFDPRYAEDIFVVFKRLHSYHEFEGTGIGLSICKKIVDRHSGFISATSKVNDGSIFTVTLPGKNIPFSEPSLAKQAALAK